MTKSILLGFIILSLTVSAEAKSAHPAKLTSSGNATKALCNAISKADVTAAKAAITAGAKAQGQVCAAQVTPYETYMSTPLLNAVLKIGGNPVISDMVTLLIQNGADPNEFVETVDTTPDGAAAFSPTHETLLAWALDHKEMALAETLVSLGAKPTLTSSADEDASDLYPTAIFMFADQPNAAENYISLVQHGMKADHPPETFGDYLPLTGLVINDMRPPATDWVADATKIANALPGQKLFDDQLLVEFNKQNAPAENVSWAFQHGLKFSQLAPGSIAVAQPATSFDDAVLHSSAAYVQTIQRLTGLKFNNVDVFYAIQNSSELPKNDLLNLVVSDVPDLNVYDAKGATPLISALTHLDFERNFDVIRGITQKTRNINYEMPPRDPNVHGTSDIFGFACYPGDYEPTTALQIAAANHDSGVAQVVSLLLSAGANPIQVSNYNGKSPLMFAIAGYGCYRASPNIDVIRQLLPVSGAVLNDSDLHTGETALMMASYTHDQTTLDMLSLILNTPNVDVNKQNTLTGETAIMKMSQYQDAQPSLQLLLDHGACLKIKNKAGATTLDRSYKDNYQFLKSVLDKQPNHC